MRSLQKQIGWCSRVQWIMGIGLGAGLLAFLLLGYRPARARIEALDLRLDAKRRELEQNQNKTRNLAYLEAAVRKLEAQVQTQGRQFPRQPELGQFMRDITQISQSLALRDWKYTHGLPKKGNGYFERPIEMRFEGDGQGVVAFLRQLEDLQRLTRVQRLSLKARDSGGSAVETVLTMSIYSSEE